MNRFVSTAIPYVNGEPHIGHAQELVIADVLARHYHPVYFQSGTDENSLKNVLSANAANIPIETYVAQQSAVFERLAHVLGLRLDEFINTSSDTRHRPFVEWLWRTCAARGDIYQDEYVGLYCVGCEQFYQESELADGKCAEHGTVPEHIAETNYFFRLSRFQEALLEHIASHRLRVEPASKRNEVVSFLSSPLKDISISRSARRAHGWGIPVPDDDSQIIYVWFDALANYASAVGRERWNAFEHVAHVIGKGVLRFHAVYWPAILLSAGLRIPDEILVHGYVTVNGGKIGKSLGNAIAPSEPIELLGVDAFRYYVLRHIGCYNDGDFSWPRYEEVYEHELANQLGNLVSRLVALLKKCAPLPLPDGDVADVDNLIERVDEQIAKFALHRAIDIIWHAVEAANVYISREQPWRLEGVARDRVLITALSRVNTIGRALTPFLPHTASRIAEALATHKNDQLFPKAM